MSSSNANRKPLYSDRFSKVYNSSLGRSVYKKRTHYVQSSTYNRRFQKPNPIAEVCEEYIQLKEALARQKALLAQLDDAKTAEERTATTEMLKLAMFHITDLQSSLAERQQKIQENQRAVKVMADRHRLKRSSTGSSVSECSTSSTDEDTKRDMVKRRRSEESIDEE